jgi:hypothetical protein
MRGRFRAIVGDTGLMEIAIGVALALAVVDLASAVGGMLVGFWQTPAPSAEELGVDADSGTELALLNLFSNDGTFEIGGHLLDVSHVIRALLEVALVLALALWLWPRAAASLERESR